MPSSLLRSYAKEANKTIEEAEKCWEKSKKKAEILFKNKNKDGHYWAFVNSATRICLGLKANPSKK